MANRIRVSWARKATGMNEIRQGGSASNITSNTKAFNANRQEFNRIVNTLDDLPSRIRKWMQDSSTYIFIVRYGGTKIAIDTSGYDYPRYKSLIK